MLLGKDGRDSTRITVTLSRNHKAELDRLSKQHGVSAAWLVRRAIERLIEQSNGGPMLPLEFVHNDAVRGNGAKVGVLDE